jgi:hypothetical protein
MPRRNWLCCSLATAIVNVLVGCATAPAPRQEQIAYVTQKLGAPQTCLALSGGGVRSAAVSIGVITELARQGLLSDIDLISGASGGSWALTWLYSNTVKEQSLAEVVGTAEAPETKAHKRVETGAFLDFAWRGWSAVWGVLRLGNSAFYGDFVHTFGAGGGYTTPQEITIAVHDNRLPVPIVTLTALNAPCVLAEGHERVSRAQLNSMSVQDRMKYFRPTGNYVVEISPQGWGNSRMGFSSEWPVMFDSMEYWVRSSGAFIDYPNLNTCPYTRALGASWGQWLPTPSDASSQSRFFAVDGGFAENLAAFPLIRRQCKLVAIIDAELDPYLEFEGYKSYKRAFENHLWLTSKSQRLINGLIVLSGLLGHRMPLMDFFPLFKRRYIEGLHATPMAA